jgi:hypothetical protein
MRGQKAKAKGDGYHHTIFNGYDGTDGLNLGIIGINS